MSIVSRATGHQIIYKLLLLYQILMKRKGIAIALIVSIGVLTSVFLFSANYVEFFFNLVFAVLTIICSSYVAGYISLEVKKKVTQASDEELKIEDSILIEGIGFFQSTAFIYLSLVTTDQGFSVITFLRLLIPIFTAAFFVMRGYGAIKRDNRWRWHSAILLILVMPFEVLMFIYLTMVTFSFDIKLFYLFVGLATVITAIGVKLIEILATRYGITDSGFGPRFTKEH